MGQQDYHYTAFMPMGRDRKIVHIKANDAVAYRFISFEQLPSGVSFCFPVKGRDDIVVVTLMSLTEENIKAELATLNGCEPENIRIMFGAPSVKVRLRRGGIPNSSEYSDGSFSWEELDRAARDLYKR